MMYYQPGDLVGPRGLPDAVLCAHCRDAALSKPPVCPVRGPADPVHREGGEGFVHDNI